MDLQFYPTPPELANKMLRKLKTAQWDRRTVRLLDPSAGEGALLDAFKRKAKDSFRRCYDDVFYYAMEIEPSRAALLKEEYRLISYDFLAWRGMELFDVILMNPPFAYGAEHLNRALDLLNDNGQLVCILNAETIKNPFSNPRKALIQRLESIGASIEYLQNQFLDAERKTAVEIALIYVQKPAAQEEVDLSELKNDDLVLDIEQENEVVNAENKVDMLVRFYNKTIAHGMEVFEMMYKAQKHFRTIDPETPRLSLNKTFNEFLDETKAYYWSQAMKLDIIAKKLPNEQRRKLLAELTRLKSLEFSYSNIDILIKDVIKRSYDAITNSAVAMFDQMSRVHAHYPETNKNIYLFNGWKTNNAFKINKRVILPFYYQYGWEYDYKVIQFLEDLHLVLGLFKKDIEKSLTEAAAKSNNFCVDKEYRTYDKLSIILNDCPTGQSHGVWIDVGAYKVKRFKKGTLHVEFNDDDMLHRFNAFVCKNKGWLPHDYGTKPKKDMTKEEQDVVNSFGDYFMTNNYLAIEV